MNVPMLLFVSFIMTIVISLDAKVSKCYEKKEDGYVVEANCTSPFDEFCAKLVCNVNGTAKIISWACANAEMCYDRPRECSCLQCFGELCNGDQLPLPKTTTEASTTTTKVAAEPPTSTTITTENPAEKNGVLGVRSGSMSAFALTTVAGVSISYLPLRHSRGSIWPFEEKKKNDKEMGKNIQK